MQDDKKSENSIQAASGNASEAAVSLPPALIEEELKKLPSDFTGTIEIPIPAPQQPEKQAVPPVENTADEFTDVTKAELDDLLWGGMSAADVPVINYGDEFSVTEGQTLPDGAKHATEEEIYDAVRKVEDPELMLNVYDLGLIYKMEPAENGDIYIEMTVTAPSCPVAGLMPKQVAEEVSKLDGVGKVTVKLVWEPAWSIDRMSENAKYMLDLF